MKLFFMTNRGNTMREVGLLFKLFGLLGVFTASKHGCMGENGPFFYSVVRYFKTILNC